MPFVKINCSALPDTLLESELFGHVKGAFTGAIKDKVGRFELANGGTIFLDEIGDISPALQTRLLRVLQERTFERVGDSKSIKVDVRIISATNQDLQSKIADKTFREDLYYRLKVMDIHIPPLHKRPEDIPLLVNYFIKQFNRRFSKKIQGVDDNVTRIFQNYMWPGNIRELEHIIERAFVVCRQPVIGEEDLPTELRDHSITTKKKIYSKQNLSERDELHEALESNNWIISKAANQLGWSRSTIYRRMNQYGFKKGE